jgi:hypothetical protein
LGFPIGRLYIYNSYINTAPPVIQLASRETISPIGIVRDVEVLYGKTKYPADFLVLGSAASKTCLIIFGRPFLNTCGAVIDCKKEKILMKFDGKSYEFNFSKFIKALYENESPNEDFRVEQLASIALAPNNALPQFMEDHESEIFREERDEIDEILLRQPSCLNTIYLWRIWVPLCHLRKILFFI